MGLHKVILLSDPHIVSGGELRYGIDPAKRLQATVDFINAFHGDADLCILLGDLVQEGRHDQYSRLKEITGQLTMEVQFIMGNHDDRDVFIQIFDPAVAGDGFVQQELMLGSTALLLLDTMNPGHVSGAYCRQRRRWLEDRLDRSPASQFLVFMHHPPFPVHVPKLDHKGLDPEDAQWLHAALSRGAKPVRHVLFGHIHRNIAVNWNGLTASSVRNTAHQRARDLNDDGTRFWHGPPCLGVLYIHDDRTLLQMQDIIIDSDGRPQAPVEELMC